MRLLASSLAGTVALVVLLTAAPPGQATVDEGPGVHVSSLPSQKVPPPSRAVGTFTARILEPTAIRRRPDGDSVRWLARTKTKWSGSIQKLMVLGSRLVGGKFWLRVRLPIRPNDASGWIPRDRVVLARSDAFILIDRSRRKLYMYRKGRLVRRWSVVVGTPSTPTPIGLFALYDRVPQADPNGFIGPWAVPLTAHSNALRRYDGGPGLVALHGRAGASLLDPLGTASSHGCIRMNNNRVRYIIRRSMGTAVKIRR